jgi:hypothetical protein
MNKLDKFKKAGLIGCLNDTGLTSNNMKPVKYTDGSLSREVEDVEKVNMEWISVDEDEKPLSAFHVVFVTDGVITCLARYIEDPVYWYGENLMEYDEELLCEVPLDEKFHEPHWLFKTGIGPFLGNDECFGSMEDITHWMPLPKPPKE